MSPITFAVKREQLVRYCEMKLLIVGLFVIGKLLWLLGLEKAYRDWANSLDYRLDDDTLAVSSCFTLGRLVLRRQELRIPLAKITDVKLVQGPLLNYLDLWCLQVQTAGMGSPLPETTLYALEDPRQARDQILQAIKAIAGNTRQ
jgi:membrane protein YdbS with pleckstrin-like domain